MQTQFAYHCHLIQVDRIRHHRMNGYTAEQEHANFKLQSLQHRLKEERVLSEREFVPIRPFGEIAL